jgi:hypothetical protein
MTIFDEPAPQWVPSEAWSAFMALRKRKDRQAPFTTEARKRILAKLECFKQQGMDIAEVLWNSVESGWTGVFPLKGRPVMASRREANQSTTDEAKRLLGIDA